MSVSSFSVRRDRSTSRSILRWVVGGIVALALVGSLVYFVILPRVAPEAMTLPPAMVARVMLERQPPGATPDGVAIALVLQDRTGTDTAMTGRLTFELQEPDGAIWRATRDVTPGAFGPLETPALLQGRLGYRIVVPSTDWARPPRRGGQAHLIVTVQPQGAASFTSVTTPTFP